MSTLSQSTELSGRRAPIAAGVQSSSSLDVHLVVSRFAPIDRPVQVALALKSFGLGLSAAHAALNRIVANEQVALTLGGAPAAAMIDRLAALGVTARLA